MHLNKREKRKSQSILKYKNCPKIPSNNCASAKLNTIVSRASVTMLSSCLIVLTEGTQQFSNRLSVEEIFT